MSQNTLTPATAGQPSSERSKPKQDFSEIDAKRRKNHFQCRLDDELGDKLRHFIQSRDISANEALKTIISKFFN